MRISDALKQGRSLPRQSWGGCDPRTKVVPAKKGRQAPYRRQPRNKSGRSSQTAEDNSSSHGSRRVTERVSWE